MGKRVNRVLKSLYGEDYSSKVKLIGAREKVLGIEDKYRSQAEGLERQNKRRLARLALEQAFGRMDDKAMQLIKQGHNPEEVIKAIPAAVEGTKVNEDYEKLHPQKIYRDATESKYEDSTPSTESSSVLYDLEAIKRRLKRRTGEVYEFPKEEEI